MECPGCGYCLVQDDETGKYSTSPNNDCPHKCRAIACPNVELCETYFPQWLLNAHMSRCVQCNIYIGRDLQIRNGIESVDGECPMCLEDLDQNVRVVVEPSCGKHVRCLPCFKQSALGPLPPNPMDPRPPFPYPDRWNEYLNAPDGIDGPIGFAGDPNYEAWNQEDAEWEERQVPDSKLLDCPVCRKVNVPLWCTQK